MPTAIVNTSDVIHNAAIGKFNRVAKQEVIKPFAENNQALALFLTFLTRKGTQHLLPPLQQQKRY